MGPFKLPSTPLVYPDISGINHYTNILLIENAVLDYQKVVNSVNASTFPVVYSTGSTKSDLLTLLHAKFTTIPRIGLFFSSSSGRTKQFLDREPLFKDNETAPYSKNLQFILNIITEFQVKNIDYLACDTLNYPNWTNYYEILTGAGVKVGASNDKTGNIKFGGDWVLESTSQDVELVYFTKSIEYYTYLLDNPEWATVNDCFYVVSGNNGYLYVSNFSSIIRVPINNPGGATTWFSNGLQDFGGMCIYQGYLYVANQNLVNPNILKINLNDATYSIFADDTNGLYNPVCLVTDGTYMYVTDGNYDTNEYSITQIPLSDASEYTINWATNAQGLYNSTDMVIYDGYLYVANLGDVEPTISKILLSDPNTYEASWATYTQGVNTPYGLLIYNGYIYVSSYNTTKISKISLIDPTGDYNEYWAISSNGLAGPIGITTDNTYLYVCNINTSTICQLDLIPPVTWGTIAGCREIVIDTSDGYLYTSTYSDNTIVRAPLNNPGGATIWFSSDLDLPRGMCIYKGYLYVANYGNSIILKINLSDATTYSIFADSTQTVNNPTYLTTDGVFMFVSNYDSFTEEYTISKIFLSNPDYNIPSWVSSIHGLILPSGMFIFNEYLYIADLDNNRIIRFLLSNVSINSSYTLTGFNNPLGMVLYNGSAYIQNVFTNIINKLELYDGGAYEPYWGSSRGSGSSLGVATDNKYIYVTTEQGNIYEISLPAPQPWTQYADSLATCTSMVIDNSGSYMYVSAFMLYSYQGEETSSSGEMYRISLTNPSTDAVLWADYTQGIIYPEQAVIYNGYLYVICNGDGTGYGNISKISLTDPTGDYNANWVNMINIVEASAYIRGLAVYNDLLFVSSNISSGNAGAVVSIININDPTDYSSTWAYPVSYGAGGIFIDPVNKMAIANDYLYVTSENSVVRINIAGLSSPANSIPNPTVYDNQWVPSSLGLGVFNSITISGNYMYLTTPSSSNIIKLSLANPTTDYNPNWATGTDGSYFPLGLATYGNNLYFGSSFTNLIFQKYLHKVCTIRGTGKITGQGSFYPTFYPTI